MPFIKHLAVVQSFTDQRVTLGIAAGCVVRAANQQVHWERRINAVKDFHRLPEVPSLERKHNQQVDIRVRARVSVSVGAEQDDPVRLELGHDLLAQSGFFLKLDHACYRRRPIMP